MGWGGRGGGGLAVWGPSSPLVMSLMVAVSFTAVNAFTGPRKELVFSLPF